MCLRVRACAQDESKKLATQIVYVPIKDYTFRYSRSLFWEVELMAPFTKKRWFHVLFGWMLPPTVRHLKMLQARSSAAASLANAPHRRRARAATDRGDVRRAQQAPHRAGCARADPRHGARCRLVLFFLTRVSLSLNTALCAIKGLKLSGELFDVWPVWTVFHSAPMIGASSFIVHRRSSFVVRSRSLSFVDSRSSQPRCSVLQAASCGRMRAIPRACLSTSACECACAQPAALTRRGSWGVPKKVLNKTELAYDGEARMREFEAFLRSVGGTQTLCASSTSFVRAGHVARALTSATQMPRRSKPRPNSTRCLITATTNVCASSTRPRCFL